MMKPIVTIILLQFGFVLTAQNRVYVDINATGANNGLSWPNAFQNLGEALVAAQPGDSIWVAKGIYRPTSGNDRTVSLVQKSGVRLYGGFDGAESSLSQRDWQANPTVLSGDIGIPGDSTDNSYTILYMDNPDSMTVLDGFTLRHGIANYASSDQPVMSPYKCGGALYMMAMDGWAYALVKNCHFEHNYAYSHGGAVYVNGSGMGSVAPQFINCTFEHNRSRLDGGALYRNGGSWAERRPDFGNCVFRGNIAQRRGGGLCYNESERNDGVDLEGCTFLNNRSNLSGGGANFNVGRATGTEISMQRCRFEANGNNGSTHMGEAFALASINGLDMGILNIDSCFFVNNDTGVVFWNDVLGTPTIKMTNSHTIGELYPSYFTLDLFSKSEVYNCSFIFPLGITGVLLNNDSYWSGNTMKRNGSVRFFNGMVGKVSNSVFVPPTSLSILKDANVEFVGNTFADKELFFFVQGGAEVNIYNTVAHQLDTIRVFLAGGPPPKIYFENCLLGNIPFCQSQPSYITCGPNNLYNLDPLFRDTANQDYSLLPCSPLLNKGSNLAASGILTDIAGNPRIQEGIVDIGAYESPAFALAAPPAVLPACASDSNGSISISPVFGCEPYDYQWLPPAGDGPDLNGLPPGQYLLSITDASGRQILDTITVGQAPAPSLSLASSNVQCGGQAGGSLLASVASGTAPFQYQWSPVAPDTAQLSKLPPGLYALTLTDANGCQDSAMASIALLGMLQPMIGGETISCNGAADGWLSLTPATGAAPFTWLWDGWPGSDSIAQPLGPGNYSVTVTDAFGCTASNTFPTMTDPAPITATVGHTDQTDLVMPNGAAVVTTVSGGTPSQPPAAPYAFSWSNGGMGQFIAGLVAGEYTVTVTDQNGCTASVTVEVDLMVGTEEAEGQALLIYPNPTADWVQVVLPARLGLAGGPENMGTARLELSDASSRVLRSAEASEGVFELRGLPSGGYVLRVRDVVGKVLFVGKVVKR